MLNLEACVGFDEGEGLGAVVAGDVDQELERAGIAVAGTAGEAHRGIDDPGTEVIREAGRRRHLDDLLEVPLHAAFALAEVGDRAVDVAEDLHLHMACLLDELLDVEVAVAEGGLRLGATALVG